MLIPQLEISFWNLHYMKTTALFWVFRFGSMSPIALAGRNRYSIQDPVGNQLFYAIERIFGGLWYSSPNCYIQSLNFTASNICNHELYHLGFWLGEMGIYGFSSKHKCGIYKSSLDVLGGRLFGIDRYSIQYIDKDALKSCSHKGVF